MVFNPFQFALLFLALPRQALGGITLFDGMDTVDQTNLYILATNDLRNCMNLLRTNFLGSTVFTSNVVSGNYQCYFKKLTPDFHSFPNTGVKLYQFYARNDTCKPTFSQCSNDQLGENDCCSNDQCVIYSNRCENGGSMGIDMAFAGDELSTRYDLSNALDCESSCLHGASCDFFTFNAKEKSCKHFTNVGYVKQNVDCYSGAVKNQRS